MIDMKRKKDNGGKGDCCTAAGQSPYSYGLQIHLDKEDMEKLDIGIMPSGSEMEITAKVIVSSTTEYDSIEGDKEKDATMSLQITAMDIDKVHDSDVAKRFYGEDKDK